MAPVPDVGSSDACHVAGMLLVAARCDHRLAGIDQLAHGDETISLLLQLRQRDGERRRSVVAAAISMRDDDRARMDFGQNPVGDGLGRHERVRISGDQIPLH